MSDAYNFTTLGITPGTWEVGDAGKYLDGKPVISEYFVRVEEDDTAIASEIINPETSEPSKANANLIATAPALLRYAMWEEESNYVNALSNEGYSLDDVTARFYALGCKYFPELKEQFPTQPDEDTDSDWSAALGKAIFKLRQDALAACGLPALVDLDGEALITREATQ